MSERFRPEAKTVLGCLRLWCSVLVSGALPRARSQSSLKGFKSCERYSPLMAGTRSIPITLIEFIFQLSPTSSLFDPCVVSMETAIPIHAPETTAGFDFLSKTCFYELKKMPICTVYCTRKHNTTLDYSTSLIFYNVVCYTIKKTYHNIPYNSVP